MNVIDGIKGADDKIVSELRGSLLESVAQIRRGNRFVERCVRLTLNPQRCSPACVNVERIFRQTLFFSKPQAPPASTRFHFFVYFFCANELLSDYITFFPPAAAQQTTPWIES